MNKLLYLLAAFCPVQAATYDWQLYTAVICASAILGIGAALLLLKHKHRN